jgi:hypothetical protein
MLRIAITSRDVVWAEKVYHIQHQLNELLKHTPQTIYGPQLKLHNAKTLLRRLRRAHLSGGGIMEATGSILGESFVTLGHAHFLLQYDFTRLSDPSS